MLYHKTVSQFHTVFMILGLNPIIFKNGIYNSGKWCLTFLWGVVYVCLSVFILLDGLIVNKPTYEISGELLTLALRAIIRVVWIVFLNLQTIVIQTCRAELITFSNAISDGVEKFQSNADFIKNLKRTRAKHFIGLWAIIITNGPVKFLLVYLTLGGFNTTTNIFFSLAGVSWVCVIYRCHIEASIIYYQFKEIYHNQLESSANLYATFSLFNACQKELDLFESAFGLQIVMNIVILLPISIPTAYTSFIYLFYLPDLVSGLLILFSFATWLISGAIMFNLVWLLSKISSTVSCLDKCTYK